MKAHRRKNYGKQPGCCKSMLRLLSLDQNSAALKFFTAMQLFSPCHMKALPVIQCTHNVWENRTVIMILVYRGYRVQRQQKQWTGDSAYRRVLNVLLLHKFLYYCHKNQFNWCLNSTNTDSCTCTYTRLWTVKQLLEHQPLLPHSTHLAVPVGHFIIGRHNTFKNPLCFSSKK